MTYLKKSDKAVWNALVMVTQVGITMMVPIFLCVFVGRWLDDFFQTDYLFIIFVLLGVFAAFRNVYLLMRKFYAKDLEKEDAQLRYFAKLKEEGDRAREERKQEETKKAGK